MTSGKVLVLGDDTRSFLATVRSLGRQGIAVHAAPSHFRSPALRSRYVRAIHDLPPWMGDGSAWLAAVTALLRAERFDLVIPCDETTLLPLQHHRADLIPYARLAMPDDRAIDVLFDKHATRELARQVGVPVAPGRLTRADDRAEDVFTELGTPVVLKPRHSYTLSALAGRGKAQVEHDPARLARLLHATESGSAVLEGFFPGQGMGVSVLASQGRVCQAFEHHRVRELGGSSYYRVSASLTPALLHACEAIVAALSYTGLAMFEFRRATGGDWILLEVNARPWGSMPLPLALGVDFPYRWYRLLTAGEETSAVAYRTGVYGRNLLPDLRITLAQAKAQQLGAVATARFMAGWAAELWRLPAGREVHDVLVRDDMRPALGELGEFATATWNRIGRMLPAAAGRRQRKARAVSLAALHGEAAAHGVVFVCQGNICRSPFAEALLRARLDDATIPVGSAGMMPQPGRSSPELAMQAARDHGLDLSAHRSRWLTRETAEQAALLLVFDEINHFFLFDRYPDLKTPVIRLGDLVALGEIADPVDGDLADFRQIYAQIASAVEEMARLIRLSRPAGPHAAGPVP